MDNRRRTLLDGDRVQYTRYYWLHSANHLPIEEVNAKVAIFLRYDGLKHAWVFDLTVGCNIMVRIVDIEPLGTAR